MPDTNFDPDVQRVAQLLADAARRVILPYFRTASLQADNKLAQGFDPVTEADRAAERAMREILARERPHDAILGEEFGAKALGCWTRSTARGGSSAGRPHGAS